MNERAAEKIPFAVEINRMIEVLAAQIYPSPFALLRENIQNSFDAILLRKHIGHEFTPRIDVDIEPNYIRVADNGIGMSRDDLRNHFWRAGSSSKNTPDARAAGVVGTFGIGAMANFGIAEELDVVTESAISGERTSCRAQRSTLSVTEDCIEFTPQPSIGAPGAEVTAKMQPGKSIDVNQAVVYITEFIQFVQIAIYVNKKLVSGVAFETAVPLLRQNWAAAGQNQELGGGLKADFNLTGAIGGEVRIELSNVYLDGQFLAGSAVFRQDGGGLRTFRSLFGLATTSLSSSYQFGGVADFLFLQPTAGREALTTPSIVYLQKIVSALDAFVSERLALRQEGNNNQHFVTWVSRHRRFDLCSNLQIRVEPSQTATLGEIRERSRTAKALVYAGNDPAIIQHASEERPLLVLSQSSVRRDCEIQFLRTYCNIEELTDAPSVLIPRDRRDWSLAESALSFRVATVLSNDYFLESEIKFGSISHQLPVIVTRKTAPVEIFIDPTGQTVRLLAGLYDREYSAFGHMAKDFVRTVIFPQVADLVPSASRQGAEAFLKAIQRNREVFEIESADVDDLKDLLKDLVEGRITVQEAAQRSGVAAARTHQVLDSTETAPVREIVPDVIDNQIALPQSPISNLSAIPPIQRLDIETQRKILTIGDDEPALKGYRCFLALTERVCEEKGDFFRQPHKTSVVWGGQRALFVFEHHSGEFGLYYDVQTREPVSDGSGGGPFETCTIVMKNRVFIPIPAPIQTSFIPATGEKKRLDVHGDILYIDRS